MESLFVIVKNIKFGRLRVYLSSAMISIWTVWKTLSSDEEIKWLKKKKSYSTCLHVFFEMLWVMKCNLSGNIFPYYSEHFPHAEILKLLFFFFFVLLYLLTKLTIRENIINFYIHVIFSISMWLI